jgi:hypothetical protein
MIPPGAYVSAAQFQSHYTKLYRRKSGIALPAGARAGSIHDVATGATDAQSL